MEFIDNITKEEYIAFETNHPKAHFLQSYEWGQFSIKGKGLKPWYVGLKNEKGELECAALLLQKRIPFGYSYIYAPRGYVIDFTNKDLIKEFTEALKSFMKKNKIIYIKIDPDVIYQEINEDGSVKENGKNNYDLYKYMLDLGYMHKGFNKLYEGNQPRYTFRIDLTKSQEEIDSRINKSFLKSVKRSYNYLLKIDNNVDIAKFCELNQSNSQKDGFEAYSKSYYEEFYKAFSEQGTVKFFNAYVPVKEVLNNIDKNIKEVEEKKLTDTKHQTDLENQLERLRKDKSIFEKETEDEVMVCSLICVYAGKYAWSLYIGSNELANYTFAVSRCYYESILDAKANGCVFYDLFGTVGDPNTNYKNLAKLHDFKRKFGDQYLEFIGEFDLVNNKFLYRLLPPALKVYRGLRKLKR